MPWPERSCQLAEQTRDPMLEPSDQIANDHGPEHLVPGTGLGKQPCRAGPRKRGSQSLGGVYDTVVCGGPFVSVQVAGDCREQRKDIAPGKETESGQSDEPN